MRPLCASPPPAQPFARRPAARPPKPRPRHSLALGRRVAAGLPQPPLLSQGRASAAGRAPGRRDGLRRAVSRTFPARAPRGPAVTPAPSLRRPKVGAARPGSPLSRCPWRTSLEATFEGKGKCTADHLRFPASPDGNQMLAWRESFPSGKGKVAVGRFLHFV